MKFLSADALTPDQELLVGWPELDCYADMRPPNTVAYLGNERFGTAGVAPVWPDSAAAGRKRIAAYLKGDYRHLESVLRALDAEYATVAYVAQLDETERQRLQTENLRLSPVPLDMNRLAAECDALVCQAGAGTAPLFLEAGKPMVLLPQQAEQRVNADCIESLGAGVSVDDKNADTLFADAIKTIAHDSRYAHRTRSTAARWATRARVGVDGIPAILERLKPSAA